MTERNLTGSPVIWGAPQLLPDGSYRTVVVAPGDPWPKQAAPVAKTVESADPANDDDGGAVTDQEKAEE